MHRRFKVCSGSLFLVAVGALAACFVGSAWADPPVNDLCPGTRLTIPAVGDSVQAAGQTYLATHNCDSCNSRGSKDVFYYFDLHSPTRLKITTCGSGFNTYLCVFKGSCCTNAPFYYNNNSTICGATSNKAALSQCFPDTGRFYIVVAGDGIAASGHYILKIYNILDPECGPTPEFPCPEQVYGRHEEPPVGSEGVCNLGVTASCDTGFCGIIDVVGDVDVYSFAIPQCKIATLSVYANDTYGRSGYLDGLDPLLRLFSGPACDHPLYTNDDFNGELPLPVQNDSRIVTLCLRPGTYWAEISGKSTTGAYEFTIECRDCEGVESIDKSFAETPPGSGYWCVNWTSTGADIYYVWRWAGSEWVLAGTTWDTHFCETVSGSPYYEVFDDPCGIPSPPD